MITTEIVPELLRGALDLERTGIGVRPHRLPPRARARADRQLLLAQAQPSGVRLVVRTAATRLELDAHRTTLAAAGAPPRPDGRYDLVVDGELLGQQPSSGGTVLVTDFATGATETREGPVGTVAFTGLPARDKLLELWLPHQEVTELVALRTDAPVAAVAPGARRVWLHHGSSISQGSNAASPTTTWAALAAARGGVDLVNLGFSGSAMLDSFVARTMRDHPADLLSAEIGINLVNADVMRMRAFTPAVHGFLDTIRDGHPTTPLLVVSPVLCPIHEDTPGPGAVDLVRRDDALPGHRRPGGRRGRPALPAHHPRGAHPHRRPARGRRPAPAPARRARALRGARRRRAPAAGPAPPRRGHPSADGGAVRHPRLRRRRTVRAGVSGRRRQDVIECIGQCGSTKGRSPGAPAR